MTSNADDIAQLVAPYLTVENVITLPVSTLSTMSVIYGSIIHYLFLSKSEVLTKSALNRRWTISLFVLATLYTASYVFGLSHQATIDFNTAITKNYKPILKYFFGKDDGKAAWSFISNFASSFMGAIADWMLIHRCCTIWQSRIMVYLLGLISVVLNGIFVGSVVVNTVGYCTGKDYNEIYSKTSMIINITAIAAAVFQALLALLTGKRGRVWWISRKARRLMGQSIDTRYNTITAIIIESGLLYAICLIGPFIMRCAVDPGYNGLVPFDFSVVPTLMSGLAPTLIIVRVAYGKSVDSAQQMVSTLQFADGQPYSAGTG
ncbi:hypothetical protein L218DRAFT_950490 [Marasmius fiardii PR-910]|nr:hypothetical protein L218DRAFT_950490 [Marasmius fiardii PR-910]